MASAFTPYTYIQCPCSDSAHLPSAARESSSRPSSSDREAGGAGSGGAAADQDGETDEDDHTFDPRSPRANYSLYPLEYLLYCEDCHQIRCPRCVAEEIVTYYCPNCLFEVPTSNLKSEGNRANLAVPEGGAASSHAGSFLLSCSFCQWSSTEIGIKFDKANGLYGQLAKVRNGGKPRLIPTEQKAKRRDLTSPLSSAPNLLPGTGDNLGGLNPSPEPARFGHGDGEGEEGLDLETQYAHLKQFYQRQLSEANGGGVGGLSSLGDLSFGSPASLSRIMNMYTSGMAGSGSRFDKKSQSRIRSMREARENAEGFQPAVLDESAAIARLHGQGPDNQGRSGGGRGGVSGESSADGWDVTASSEQRAAQTKFIGDEHLHGRARFLDELRPIPFLLRTKRSKRCPICRHIISKPEAKSTNNRFRIRLVAGSYIPSISIRPLQGGAPVPVPTSRSATAAAAAAAAAAVPNNILEPLKPVQYILTFKNPIFESVKVTLATPSTTPGRFASKVTVLCPQFEIDSNTDVWDDALRDSVAGGGGSSGGSGSRSRRAEDGGGQQQAIAGKIWERGRNWVSIVVEVVPPSLDLDLLAMTSKPIGKVDEGASKRIDLSPLREDEDIVEIPMFVRVEWETDAGQDGVGVSSAKDKDVKEKRELAYWCVLGIGRVRHD
ncbi:dynactin 4 [Sporothrix brasiliensis 5110]|uniref:Dynactin subunit 4 n=1 Tax=Sporothrix brasiliensis 5110 TaxID=1398154 RepID=A0A0C2IR03_9PEZI|nr:dynactin 4 [Sporothrix brasiliensis 5110]KIH89310.1 dynactin 4 [Sporothrix brasiliensis 5110]